MVRIDDSRILKILENIERRLSKIEQTLSEESPEKSPILKSKSMSMKPKSYEGVIGGIQLLIDNNFFSKPRAMREVFDELKREGYFYSLQAVDTALRRSFIVNRKSLSRIMADKIWK